MMARFKDQLFKGAFGALVGTGAHRWGRRFGQGLGVILTMHHVRPAGEPQFDTNELLSITPEFLDTVLSLIRAEGYDLIGLDEAASRIVQGHSPRFFVALTFDDGYRDNTTHALPVLRRHGVPWTMFICTGFADRTASLWWLELEAALRGLQQVRVGSAQGTIDLPTRTFEQKQKAFQALYWHLRPGPEANLRAAITRLAREAGVDGQALVRDLCLDWDEIAALKDEPGLTIGAHTLTHPMLARLDIASTKSEITQSKMLLEARLGQPIRHFAYPVGDGTSAGPREFALAQKAGFATAVTTRPGHLWPEHAAHLTALPRVSLNGFHQNATALKAMFSGLPFRVLNKGRRLNLS
jgi:peptidoglycan/xylan/chitin deacetylase (PgdA/CDA1 family)